MNPTHFPHPSCELCGLTFSGQEELRSHMDQHAGTVPVSEKVLDCTNCRKTLLTFNDFDRHNRQVHAPY